MTTPTPPVESSAHRMATRLDVIAAAMFVDRIRHRGHLLSTVENRYGSRADVLAETYMEAARDLAELDRLEAERKNT